MADLTAKATFSSDTSRLRSDLTRTEARLDRFNSRMKTSFTRTAQVIDRTSSVFLTRFNGMITGAAIGLAAKKVIDFDKRLAALAVQAGISKKEMFELKQTLYDIGKVTHQQPGDLLSGIEVIVERTGDYKFAIAALKDMGVVATAASAEVGDIGAATSDLREKMGITKGEVLEVFDILNTQGKEAAFSVREMAKYFPELLSAAAGFGVYGVKGMRSFGAYLQMARRGTGTAAEASTAVVRAMSDIIQKYKVIQKLTGFSIFDEEKSRAAGRHVLKDFDVVMKEIVRRTKGDEVKLLQIFGEESIKGVRPLASSFQKYGDFREFDRFSQMGGSGAMTMKDFAFMAETAAAKFGDLNVELQKFMQNLEGPINLLTKMLDIMNAHPNLTQGGLMALMGGGGVAVGVKLGKWGVNLYKWLKGLGAGSVAAEVTRDATLGSTLFEAPASTKGIKALMTRGPKGLLGAGRGLAWLTKGITVTEAAAGLGLGTTGAILGGTLLTSMAATLGMNKLMGDPAGKLGAIVYDLLHSAEKGGVFKPEVKNINNIVINMDRFGRTTANADNLRTKTNVTVNNRGSLLN